ncbi:MAG: hypothetical protein ACLPID_05425 [Beijerinckiaceae bacterium]
MQLNAGRIHFAVVHALIDLPLRLRERRFQRHTIDEKKRRSKTENKNAEAQSANHACPLSRDFIHCISSRANEQSRWPMASATSVLTRRRYLHSFAIVAAVRDWRFWPIGSFCCAAELGRYRA